MQQARDKPSRANTRPDHNGTQAAGDPAGETLLLADGIAQQPEEIGLSTEPTEEVA